MKDNKTQSNEMFSETGTAGIERVLELDPEKIEGAFVADRLSEAAQGDDSFNGLVASI